MFAISSRMNSTSASRRAFLDLRRRRQKHKAGVGRGGIVLDVEPEQVPALPGVAFIAARLADPEALAEHIGDGEASDGGDRPGSSVNGTLNQSFE